jgi:hypothetical protein
VNPTLTPRGYRGHGGGMAAYVEAPVEFRGTTNQVAGLWPWIAGSGIPSVGVPIGRDIFSGSAVHCDPHSWFTRAALLAAPTCLILGRPGLGKSSLITRMCIGLSGFGVTPVILGDLKGEHVALVEALDGNVVRLGRGQGSLNVIDQGVSMAAAARLTGQARQHLLADSLGRRLNMLGALVELNRRGAVTDLEEAVLVAALRLLDERHQPGEAVIDDLIAVLEEGPDQVRHVTLSRDRDERYRDAVDPIEASLLALTDGALGDVFARHTSVPIDLTRPLCVELASIGESDTKLAAAALLATWTAGFASIDARHALADAGLEEPANFFCVLDELWRVLQASEHMAARVRALTRLNRQSGTSLAMVTHSLADLSGGLAERAGYVVSFGVPSSELDALETIVGLSQKERDLLVGWASPPTFNVELGRESDPPGRGKALIKIAQRPGVAVDIQLTQAEKDLHNTNARWQMQGVTQ